MTRGCSPLATMSEVATCRSPWKSSPDLTPTGSPAWAAAGLRTRDRKWRRRIPPRSPRKMRSSGTARALNVSRCRARSSISAAGAATVRRLASLLVASTILTRPPTSCTVRATVTRFLSKSRSPTRRAMAGPAQPQHPGHENQGTEPRWDLAGELIELMGGDGWPVASLGWFEMKPPDRAPRNQIRLDRGVHDGDQGADIGTDRLWRQPTTVHLIDSLSHMHGRDRVQGERTELGDEVGAQRGPIPSQGSRTLARFAGQPVLGPFGERHPPGARIDEGAAQHVGLGDGEPLLRVCLRGERVWRDDTLTQAVVVANLPPTRWQATHGAKLSTPHAESSSVAPIRTPSDNSSRGSGVDADHRQQGVRRQIVLRSSMSLGHHHSDWAASEGRHRERPAGTVDPPPGRP